MQSSRLMRAGLAELFVGLGFREYLTEQPIFLFDWPTLPLCVGQLPDAADRVHEQI